MFYQMVRHSQGTIGDGAIVVVFQDEVQLAEADALL